MKVPGESYIGKERERERPESIIPTRGMKTIDVQECTMTYPPSLC